MSVEEWESVHKDRAWGRWPCEPFVQFVGRRWKGIKGARFLELGCGIGAQLAFLAAEGHIATGIDGSQSAIDRVALLMAERRVAAFLYRDDITKTDGWKDFDAIVDVACLQHVSLEDAAAVIKRASGWLKPNGVFWSKMAFDGDFPVDTPSPRFADWTDIQLLFDGWDLVLGKERTARWTIGSEVRGTEHWIIEATPK